MNYELAKELKDAGFPQKYPTGAPTRAYNSKGRHYWMHDSSNDDQTHIIHDGYTDNALDDKQLTFIPTLSELFEACGEDFASLIRKNGGWEANSKFFVDKEGIASAHNWIGSTPEEAVARLYLQLNKKS